jgi:hypothetical protein
MQPLHLPEDNRRRHYFLGRTNPTGDFRQIFLLRARSGTKIKLSLFSFMDNQSIFKYSWEILPKKWVHKMKRALCSIYISSGRQTNRPIFDILNILTLLLQLLGSTTVRPNHSQNLSLILPETEGSMDRPLAVENRIGTTAVSPLQPQANDVLSFRFEELPILANKTYGCGCCRSFCSRCSALTSKAGGAKQPFS